MGQECGSTQVAIEEFDFGIRPEHQRRHIEA